ncbi:hypothetical protein [Janibacter sp. Soil728]|uniref:hypothetical protein n=1 Tax=Janibacter sp. Soil728 TaxID=1736393 RepID=UPI000A516971|nr:hypothetical protein [Janibacter sp. Soil728]
MSFPQYSPQPAERGRPWVLIVGSVLLLVSLLMCAVGGFLGVRPLLDLADQPEQTAPQVVQLAQGDSRAVWSQTQGASCTVTGPDAAMVTDTSTGESSASWGGKSFERVMSFEADTAGDYTVSCTAPFVVGDDMSIGGIVMGTFGSMLCCFAVVILAVGLVLWLSRRRRA